MKLSSRKIERERKITLSMPSDSAKAMVSKMPSKLSTAPSSRTHERRTRVAPARFTTWRTWSARWTSGKRISLWFFSGSGCARLMFR